MPVLGLVLDVRRRDRDTALLLLGSVVDLVEALGLPAVRLGEDLRDGSGQRRRAVVDMCEGADEEVLLDEHELIVRHCG
jgi:hypothetical protein